MGRKKKRYIDKKNAVTFKLVHGAEESQINDEGNDDSSEQPHKFGIHYSDGYDYMQHLKKPGKSGSMYPVAIETPGKKFILNNKLQDSLGAEVTVESELNRMVGPVSGPQPDLDPEVSEVLDLLEEANGSDTNESLEDDFVLQANEEVPSIPTVGDNEDRDPLLDPCCLQRRDTHHTSSDGGDLSSSEGDDDCCQLYDEQGEHRKAQFTNMTSSTKPRSEGLTYLDERFEVFIKSYEDNQIGPLHDDDELDDPLPDGEEDNEIEKLILDAAVKEFMDKYSHLTSHISGNNDKSSIKSGEGINSRSPGSHCHSNRGHDHTPKSEGSDSEEELVRVSIDQKQKWDCESILSTYSNLYNHPTLIKEPPRPSQHKYKNRLKSDGQVSLSEGDTSSVMDSIDTASTVPIAANIRPKNETKEERRIRKQAVKLERKEKRQSKKEMKMAFKREQLRQEKEIISNPVLAKIT